MFKKVIATFLIFYLLELNSHAAALSFKNYVIFGDGLTYGRNYTWSNAGQLKNTLTSNDGGRNYAVPGMNNAAELQP